MHARWTAKCVALSSLVFVGAGAMPGGGQDQTAAHAADVEFGEAAGGLRLGLTTESADVLIGARLRIRLVFQRAADAADKQARLLNCGETARSVRFLFRNRDTGKTYERRPFDVGLPPAFGPKDIVHLNDAPAAAEKVAIHLLSEKGQQIPQGKYDVRAFYENNANPRVHFVFPPDGSIRQRPYTGPLKFWTGKLVSAPLALTISPAESKLVEIKTNSHLVVRGAPDGVAWAWGEQMPIRLRVKQRPGYTLGAKYDLHVFLDGKEVEYGGGGLGGPWRAGDGESYLPPRIAERVAAGAHLTLRADVTIFETSMPVQHHWQPEGGDFKALWKGPAQGSLAGPAAK